MSECVCNAKYEFACGTFAFIETLRAPKTVTHEYKLNKVVETLIDKKDSIISLAMWPKFGNDKSASFLQLLEKC